MYVISDGFHCCYQIPNYSLGGGGGLRWEGGEGEEEEANPGPRPCSDIPISHHQHSSLRSRADPDQNGSYAPSKFPANRLSLPQRPLHRQTEPTPHNPPLHLSSPSIDRPFLYNKQLTTIPPPQAQTHPKPPSSPSPSPFFIFLLPSSSPSTNLCNTLASSLTLSPLLPPQTLRHLPPLHTHLLHLIPLYPPNQSSSPSPDHLPRTDTPRDPRFSSEVQPPPLVAAPHHLARGLPTPARRGQRR